MILKKTFSFPVLILFVLWWETTDEHVGAFILL